MVSRGYYEEEASFRRYSGRNQSFTQQESNNGLYRVQPQVHSPTDGRNGGLSPENGPDSKTRSRIAVAVSLSFLRGTIFDADNRTSSVDVVESARFDAVAHRL